MEYRVSWAPDGESFRGASDTDWNANTTATSMTITGLTGGSDYKVKVRARFDSNPKSDWSNVATATATALPPLPPPFIQPPEPDPTPDYAESHSGPCQNSGCLYQKRVGNKFFPNCHRARYKHMGEPNKAWLVRVPYGD